MHEGAVLDTFAVHTVFGSSTDGSRAEREESAAAREADCDSPVFEREATGCFRSCDPEN